MPVLGPLDGDQLVATITTVLDSYLDSVDPEDIDTDALADNIATALERRARELG
jgi:hypothetical protein